MPEPPLLAVRELDAGYGDFQALFGVSIDVERGEAVAVIGANGAGKSTLLKLITHVIPPTAGTVETFGETQALLSIGTVLAIRPHEEAAS